METINVYSLNGYTSYLDGATVYFDDKDCGTLDTSRTRPSTNDAQYIEFRSTTRDCDTASSIKIESTSGMGLAICGITVFDADQFPI